MFAFELSFNIAMYYKINQWFAIRKANVENTWIHVFLTHKYMYKLVDSNF